jgi:hypothetical protein
MFVFIKQTEDSDALIVNTDFIVLVDLCFYGKDKFYPELELSTAGGPVGLRFLAQESQEKALQAWLDYAAQNKVEM